MWFNTKTNQIYNYIYEIRQAFYKQSLPDCLTDSILESLHVYPITKSNKPDYNPLSQKLVFGSPELIDGKWTVQYLVLDMTQEEIDFKVKTLSSDVRVCRNQLLKDSDWTQSKDIPDDISSVWATYRQALRDITDQEGFPLNVTFPEKPE